MPLYQPVRLLESVVDIWRKSSIILDRCMVSKMTYAVVLLSLLFSTSFFLVFFSSQLAREALLQDWKEKSGIRNNNGQFQKMINAPCILFPVPILRILDTILRIRIQNPDHAGLYNRPWILDLDSISWNFDTRSQVPDPI